MAETSAVVGASPVTFISENTSGSVGKQYQIPLCSLKVDRNGAPDASDWLASMGIPPGSADYALVTSLIARLFAQGFFQSPTAQ
jgi:hypothetical protein